MHAALLMSHLKGYREGTFQLQLCTPCRHLAGQRSAKRARLLLLLLLQKCPTPKQRPPVETALTTRTSLLLSRCVLSMACLDLLTLMGVAGVSCRVSVSTATIQRLYTHALAG